MSEELRDLEEMVKLLEELVLKLKNACRENDLKSGFLYETILKKLSKSLLIS